MGKRKAAEGESSKSDLIRAYKQQHPDLGPTRIAAELSEKTGMAFSPALVSNVLGKAGLAGGTRRGRQPTAARDDSPISQDAVAKAAELIKVAGSAEAAEQVLRQVAAIARILS